MAVAPKPGRTPIVSAAVKRIRAELAEAGIAATRTMDRLRDDRNTSERAVAPTPEHLPIADEAQSLRTGLADAGITVRRTLSRIGWARLIIVAAAQLVIALIAWRISVRRERRVQLSVEAVLERQPPASGAG